VGHHKVWGATAMVLCELLALLQTVDGDPDFAISGQTSAIAAAHDPRY
jgi:hypothetical protein